MTDRYLTITLQPDWKGALRAAAQVAKAGTYRGEVLNFETPAQFFGQLTEKRWDIVRAAQGKGDLSVRELARLVDRDVKRVHQDVVILADLGLLEMGVLLAAIYHRWVKPCLPAERHVVVICFLVLLALTAVTSQGQGWAGFCEGRCWSGSIRA